MLLRGYSKALFSTWFHLPEVRGIFDAGEGINFSLGGRLTKVDAVFLTHGHTDHFTGLLNLLIARTRLGPRDSSELPPITVFYPEASANLKLYLDYVRRHLASNHFPDVVRYQPVEPGRDYALPTQRRHFARVFRVPHGPFPAVGYCVFETRDKVRPEYVDRSPSEIGKLIHQEGKDKILRPVDVPLVCYTGDSDGPVEAPCEGPKLLMHEATFLNEEERAGSNHAILAEALDAARRMRPSELLLYHFSARYFPEEIRSELARQLEAHPLPDCQVSYVLPGRMFVRNST